MLVRSMSSLRPYLFAGIILREMGEMPSFQLGVIGALFLSVASSVSIVICNKALMSNLGFPFGKNLLPAQIKRACILLKISFHFAIVIKNRELRIEAFYWISHHKKAEKNYLSFFLGCCSYNSH